VIYQGKLILGFVRRLIFFSGRHESETAGEGITWRCVN